MDVQATKLELMRLLLNTQKEQVLLRIKEIFEQQAEDADFWNALNEDQKREIKKGLAELDAGQKHDYEQVISKYR